MTRLLAPLAAGHQIPGAWLGKPAWFTVVSYDDATRTGVLRNPDGTTRPMRDSE